MEFTSPPHAFTDLAELSSLANWTGVDFMEWAFPSLSLYSQRNSELGDGGGPRVRVRIRWISRIMVSLVAVRLAVEVDERRRRISASSRSLVVISWLIAEED